MEKPTAAEMWKTIYNAAQTQIVSDRQRYYTEFYAYRIKATKSMSAQILELQDIQTRANTSGLTINNKQFISQIAVILPDSYRLIWGSILRAVGGYEKATIDLIRGELQQEQTMRELLHTHGAGDSRSKSNYQKGKGNWKKKGGKGKGQDKTYNQQQKNDGKHYCKKCGKYVKHTEAEHVDN
jgi:hypothetical protein